MSATEYCYSTDGESYFGRFATREEAIGAAFDEADEGDVAFEDLPYVWVAEVKPAADCLSPSLLGDHVMEYVEESLFEEIGGEEPAFDAMTASQKTELGLAIIEWLRTNVTATRYGIRGEEQVDRDRPEQGGEVSVAKA